MVLVRYIILFLLFPSLSFGLSQDSNGWTVLEPSADSRVVYVSNTGNDGTCDYYELSDNAWEVSGTPIDPDVGETIACETYAQAKTFTRSGYPDWILFKRGDAFTEQLIPISGKDSDEYSVYHSYGTTGALPTFYYASGHGITTSGSGLQYFAMRGLDFYEVTRDPDSGSYVGDNTHEGFKNIASSGTWDYLIEGCRFRFFYNGFNIQNTSTATITATFRRCTVIDNWTDIGHSQGGYSDGVSITLEENIFDHNGWYSQSPGTPGTATVYNHNTYFANNTNTTFSKNIFLRSSSIQNKFTANNGAASSTNLTVDNNLYVDGEIGISMGGNENDAYKFQTISITNNVLLNMGRSQPTNRTLGWGIDLIDIDGGTVQRNIVAHNDNGSLDNLYGFFNEGTSKNLSILDNIVYDLKDDGIRIGSRAEDGANSNVVYSNNKIQLPNSADYIVNVQRADENGITFSGNTYYSDATAGQEFYRNSAALSTASWASATGDNSTWSEVSFTDPRTIEDYQTSIGETATIDAFITACRAQSYINWDTRYMADAVNDYIRSGFDLFGNQTVTIGGGSQTIWIPQ